MENIKCSIQEHEQMKPIMYCLECKINMCNKCLNFHSALFKNHHTYNIDNNIENIFIDICKENNHNIKLEYYCKNHNKLCCCACISKIKKNGKGNHHDCDICTIDEIINMKKNNLIENVKILEDLSINLDESINELKNLFEKINKDKEEIKLNINKQFTKIRNALNEREDELLLNIDKLFDNEYIKEDFIKDIEKYPKKIKLSLEKGKKMKDEWNDNNLPQLINNCINIENVIKEINLFKKNLSKNINFESEINFFEENNEVLYKAIKIYGVLKVSQIFTFKKGQNYEISNNGKIATKTGNDGFNCSIIGNKEIPKNKKSSWKFKINSEIKNAFIIGIGPENTNNINSFYINCWSFDIFNMQLILHSGNYSEYTNNKFKIKMKKNDIIAIEVNRIDNSLSFYINDTNCGIACTNIPQDETLYPVIIPYNCKDSIEIIDYSIY